MPSLLEVLKEVRLIAPNADPYADAESIAIVDDLLQQDVEIRRWFHSGKSLKLRIRALTLEQQDTIHQEALTQNKKTKEWEEPRPAFCAATLQRGVVVPPLDAEQAKALRKKNPVIVEALVSFIWAMSLWDESDLEALAFGSAPPNPDTEADSAADDASDTEGAE